MRLISTKTSENNLVYRTIYLSCLTSFNVLGQPRDEREGNHYLSHRSVLED